MYDDNGARYAYAGTDENGMLMYDGPDGYPFSLSDALRFSVKDGAL